MRKEIDILLKAVGKSCAVVEKETNLLWSEEELIEARKAGRFQTAGHILPPDGHEPVSSPYPGCMQGGANARSDSYRLIGQTEHFAIFAGN